MFLLEQGTLTVAAKDGNIQAKRAGIEVPGELVEAKSKPTFSAGDAFMLPRE